MGTKQIIAIKAKLTSLCELYGIAAPKYLGTEDVNCSYFLGKELASGREGDYMKMLRELVEIPEIEDITPVEQSEGIYFHIRLAKPDDGFIPIPPPAATRPTELFLTMAYDPYDRIKAGTKKTEFRDYTPYWVNKILANRDSLKTIRFQRGYGSKGGGKPEQMVWTIKGITIYDSASRKDCAVGSKPPDDFHPDMIAIDLEQRMG